MSLEGDREELSGPGNHSCHCGAGSPGLSASEMAGSMWLEGSEPGNVGSRGKVCSTVAGDHARMT